MFHLSADGSLLRYAPADGFDRLWQRVLLDTVLWSTSALRGFELLHASAAETAAGVLAFVGVSGGGKTTLAAECLRRGGRLFCDDILALAGDGDRVVAYPGPPLMNLPQQISPESLGEVEVIARFQDEQWVYIKGPPAAARELSGIVLVERRQGELTTCSEVDATSLTLLPHAVRLSNLPLRTKRSFELFAILASTTPIFRLTADSSVPVHQLAELVQATVGVP